jgi:type II secretory pathway component GspD/PulD (secretin)
MLKMSLIIGLVALAVSPLLAADDQTFEQKEQQLLSAAEPEVQTEAKAETIEIPKEVGEEDGFWTKIKKAFATKEEKPDLDNKTEQEIQVLMFEGRTYYRKGEYQKALNTFAEVTKRDPYNPLARRYMSSCNEKLLRIEEDNVDLTALQRIQDVEKSMLIMTEKQKDRDEAVANAGISTVTDEKMNRVIKELSFVDEPMVNVLESIRDEANLNLVMQPAAANSIQNATLTLSLPNISVADALDMICKLRKLNYSVDGESITITTQDSARIISRTFRLSRGLDSIEVLNKESLRTPTDKAKELLRRIGVTEVKDASVVYDARTNQLIVRNTADNLALIEKFLKNFDKTPSQVEIEARFVTVANDDMNELVFRHFLTHNYRWNRKDKYGDKYYLEAPNKEREMTSGLRYIRSFMDDDAYDPVGSAYRLPDMVDTGSDYGDYMSVAKLRPNQPAYGNPAVDDIQSMYSSLEQNTGTANEYKRKAQSSYQAMQNFYRQYQSILDNSSAPNRSFYMNQLETLRSNYYSNAQSYVDALGSIAGSQSSIANANVTDVVANDGLGKVFDISGVLGPAQYRSVIYALANQEGVETIFAPKVTVVSGNRAELKEVIRVRYNKTIEEAEDQDVDVGDAQSVIYDYAVTPKDWETREYGTKLVVTPSVQTDERTIELEVNPEVSDLLGFRRFVSSRNNVYELPQFFVQNLKTTVLVNDGDTLVMGGLMKNDLIRTKDRTPILADLPWIGRFWRGESEVAKKSNLLIFINAKLVDPSGTPRRGATVKTAPTASR